MVLDNELYGNTRFPGCKPFPLQSFARPPMADNFRHTPHNLSQRWGSPWAGVELEFRNGNLTVGFC